MSISKCCDDNLQRQGYAFVYQSPEGTRWTCPTCGIIWEHICDEAEGCQWESVGNEEMVELHAITCDCERCKQA